MSRLRDRTHWPARVRRTARAYPPGCAMAIGRLHDRRALHDKDHGHPIPAVRVVLPAVSIKVEPVKSKRKTGLC